MRACIAGWGTALPDARVTNADLEQRVETSDQWIVERTGIRERRVAGPEDSTATLAIAAGAAGSKQSGGDPPPHRRLDPGRPPPPAPQAPHRRARGRGAGVAGAGAGPPAGA